MCLEKMKKKRTREQFESPLSSVMIPGQYMALEISGLQKVQYNKITEAIRQAYATPSTENA